MTADVTDEPEAAPWEACEATCLDWLEQPPGTGDRVVRQVLVEFDWSKRIEPCDAREVAVELGDRVVVEAAGGPRVGTVTARPAARLCPRKVGGRVVRRASGDDERREQRCREREELALTSCREGIRRHRVRLKPLVARSSLDLKKMTVFFESEARIDFRPLVRDLSRELRGRVEMRQVGARDGARLVGGTGPCGRELCCSTWLQSFAPVSIRHAKSQNLEMYLDKVQGCCGRLMCCLVYEHETYGILRQGLPRMGRTIETPMGPGRVREVNVPLRKVRVQVGPNDFRVFTAAELGIAPPEGGEPEPVPEPEPVELAAAEPEPAAEAGEDRKTEGGEERPGRPGPGRGRRRGRRRRPGGGGTEQA